MANNQDDFDIPSLVPDRDELVYHRKKKRRGTSSSSAAAIPVLHDDVVARSSGAVRFLLTLLTLGMFASGAAGYYFYTENEAGKVNLQRATNRILELERTLSVVGENTEETTLGLLRRIETNFTEIDKLWAARNQNRTDIAALKTTVDGLAETSKAMETAVANQGNMLTQNANALTNLDNRINTLTGNLTNIGNLGQQLNALNAELNRIKGSMSSLESDVAGRMRNTEQDIESINAFRLQVNQSINTMQDSINRLQQRVGQ